MVHDCSARILATLPHRPQPHCQFYTVTIPHKCTVGILHYANDPASGMHSIERCTLLAAVRVCCTVCNTHDKPFFGEAMAEWAMFDTSLCDFDGF